MMTSILTYSRTVQGAAVRNVLENELGRDPGHVVTPGRKVGNDVLERVEGSPWVAQDGDRVERREGEKGKREGRGRGEGGEREGRGRGEGGKREGRGRGEGGKEARKRRKMRKRDTSVDVQGCKIKHTRNTSGKEELAHLISSWSMWNVSRDTRNRESSRSMI